MTAATRNLPTSLLVTEACERDFDRFGFTERTVSTLARYLRQVPVSSEDLAEGPVVFRPYGHHVLVYTHAISATAHQICLLGLREYKEPTTMEKLEPWAERLALIKGLI